MAKRFLPFLILFLFPIVSTAQTDYENLWDKVGRFESRGLPKSALEVVETIQEKAENDDNSTQSIKALMFKGKYILVFKEEAKLKVVQDFKEQIVQSDFPEKNILESILANLYRLDIKP